MPITIFENKNGKLVLREDLLQKKESSGWWCSIFPADIDQDGDMDYFLGKCRYKSTIQTNGKRADRLTAGDYKQ